MAFTSSRPPAPSARLLLCCRQQLLICCFSSLHFPSLISLVSLFFWSIWLPQTSFKAHLCLVSPLQTLSHITPFLLKQNPSSLTQCHDHSGPCPFILPAYSLVFNLAGFPFLHSSLGSLMPAFLLLHSPLLVILTVPLTPSISSCNHAHSARFLSNPPRGLLQSLQGKAALLSLSVFCALATPPFTAYCNPAFHSGDLCIY